MCGVDTERTCKSMPWSLILIFSLSFLSKTSISKIIVEIIETKNNLKSVVPTKILTRSNINVSLSCKLIDSKNETYFDSQVVWFKRRKVLGLNKMKMFGEGNLTFNPIKSKNSGRYLCTSFKNLSKTISIIVHSFNLSKIKQRQKRSDELKSNDLPANSIMYNAQGNRSTTFRTREDKTSWAYSQTQGISKPKIYHGSPEPLTLRENNLNITQGDAHFTNSTANKHKNNSNVEISKSSNWKWYQRVFYNIVCAILILIGIKCKAILLSLFNKHLHVNEDESPPCNVQTSVYFNNQLNEVTMPRIIHINNSREHHDVPPRNPNSTRNIPINAPNFCNQQNGIPVIPTTRQNTASSMLLTNLIVMGHNNSEEYFDVPPTYADSTRNPPRITLQNGITVPRPHAPPPTYSDATRNPPRIYCRRSSNVDTDPGTSLPPAYDEALIMLNSGHQSQSNPVNAHTSGDDRISKK